MPIHDWTRVTAGTWHDFHVVWIAELRNALNGGLLPPSYYAQAEQIAGPMGPDVLTLRTAEEPEDSAGSDSGSVAVATARPKPRLVAKVELEEYALKRRTLVIRHASGDRIVALIEIVSPGNKASQFALRSFVDKAVEALCCGHHLLIVDLFPPGPRDPEGIPNVIWGTLCDATVSLPAGSPLTLSAFMAGPAKEYYLEATAVGRELIEMPLFLAPARYVNVPLEETYRAAYRGVPRRWKRVLEGPE